MYKRPTAWLSKMKPNIKNVPANTVLYKGISNNKRVYERPVYFTFSKNYAQLYAKARLGQYVVKKPLRLLEMTPKTIKWLVLHSDMSQLNRNRLAYIMGSNMTVREQIALLNKISKNEDEKKYRLNVMMKKLAETKTPLNAPGGRKSFQNLNFNVHRALCAFCVRNGYDGLYSPEIKTPYHGLFGAELILCSPRNALVNINFLLKNE
jgi:hypothetical protein